MEFVIEYTVYKIYVYVIMELYLLRYILFKNLSRGEYEG